MKEKIEEQDVEDGHYLVDDEFADDDRDSEEEDMDIDDLEDDYFLDE